MELNEIRVTIGLPTYNRAELLPACVKSVLEQSYRNWELIISDDNSSDDTPKVAQELVKLDPRIRYFRQASSALLPKNRNTIFSLSNCDLIFFLEDDVILEKDCLANLICAYKELAALRKVAAIMPRMITENDADSTKSEGKEVVVFSKWTGLDKPSYYIDLEGRARIPSGHACSLIAKQAWSQVGGYDETRYKGTCFREETDFYLRTGQKGYEIYFEPKAIIYHLKYRSGGCHSSPLKDDYYYARNHILFLLRFYRLTSAYMIPLFLVYLGGRLILRGFRP